MIFYVRVPFEYLITKFVNIPIMCDLQEINRLNNHFVTSSTPHIYNNKGIKIQILIKSIFKIFLNTSLLKE